MARRSLMPQLEEEVPEGVTLTKGKLLEMYKVLHASGKLKGNRANLINHANGAAQCTLGAFRLHKINGSVVQPYDDAAREENIGELLNMLLLENNTGDTAELTDRVAQDFLAGLLASGRSPSTAVNNLSSMMHFIDTMFNPLVNQVCSVISSDSTLTSLYVMPREATAKELLRQLKRSAHFYATLVDNNLKQFTKKALANFAVPDLADLSRAINNELSAEAAVFFYLYQLAPGRAGDNDTIEVYPMEDCMEPLKHMQQAPNHKCILFVPRNDTGGKQGLLMLKHSKTSSSELNIVRQKIPYPNVQRIKNVMKPDLDTIAEDGALLFSPDLSHRCVKEIYNRFLYHWHQAYLAVTNQSAKNHSPQAFLRKIVETNLAKKGTAEERMRMGHSHATAEEQYNAGYVADASYLQLVTGSAVPQFNPAMAWYGPSGELMPSSHGVVQLIIDPLDRNYSYTEGYEKYIKHILDMEWKSHLPKDLVAVDFKRNIGSAQTRKGRILGNDENRQPERRGGPIPNGADLGSREEVEKEALFERPSN